MQPDSIDLSLLNIFRFNILVPSMVPMNVTIFFSFPQFSCHNIIKWYKYKREKEVFGSDKDG